MGCAIRLAGVDLQVHFASASMCAVITRRDFARTVGLAAAATSLASCAPAPSSAAPPPSRTSFASLKQIDAGVLNVGYAEDGPADGPPVILLHGWPYDIHSYVDVAPLLAARGYRVLVPYLRGYGSTRFLRRTPCATGSRRPWPLTSSRSWMRCRSRAR